MPPPDPDRFFDSQAPGSQEWWYFDAISDDGRDALVVIFYAALPFDPSYGVAALRHLKAPARHPAPVPLDHCAVGISWYRPGAIGPRRPGRGKPGPGTVAFALDGHRRDAFSHRADPFAVAIASSRLDRDEGGYRLRIRMKDVDARRAIAADLRFAPAAASSPVERNLGTPEAPHLWIMAAADCRVSGRVAVDGPGDRAEAVDFAGRGYHDHNAGSEELSRAMRRWEWGRVHAGDRAAVYYRAEPRVGPTQSLWIVCRDGRPESVRDDATIAAVGSSRTPFGIRHPRELIVEDAATPARVRPRARVDDGPFYVRWLADFRLGGGGLDLAHAGIAELLDTRRLNSPLVNWMIPYRLIRPPAGPRP